MTEIRTERLLLRPARAGDLDDLFAVYSDRRSMEFWSCPPHETPDQTRFLIRPDDAPEPTLYLAIEHQGRVIGTCGIHAGDEFGYILRSDMWGLGLAKEATGAYIARIWETTDRQRITADVDPRNLASIGLLTRLGFQMTGFAKDTFCVAGHWSDSAYFQLVRPDAERSKSQP